VVEKVKKIKKKKIKAEDRSSVLEPRFVDVFRSLKAQATETVAEAVQEPVKSDWLKQLRSSAAPEATVVSAPTAVFKKTHRADKPFWRQDDKPEDANERRELQAFVRADAKQQRIAAKRKNKNRRLF